MFACCLRVHCGGGGEDLALLCHRHCTAGWASLLWRAEQSGAADRGLAAAAPCRCRAHRPSLLPPAAGAWPYRGDWHRDTTATCTLPFSAATTTVAPVAPSVRAHPRSAPQRSSAAAQIQGRAPLTTTATPVHLDRTVHLLRLCAACRPRPPTA